MAERITNLKNKGVCNEQSDAEEDTGNNWFLALQKLNNVGRRKKLLVLGLGGLLCHRVCKRDVSDIPRSRYPDAFYGSILGQINKSLSLFLSRYVELLQLMITFSHSLQEALLWRIHEILPWKIWKWECGLLQRSEYNQPTIKL